MGSEYVCLAHAKGLPRSQIFVRYAMRNALLPSLTSFGMALGFIVSGSLLTEVVFLSWAGLLARESRPEPGFPADAGPVPCHPHSQYYSRTYS